MWTSPNGNNVRRLSRQERRELREQARERAKEQYTPTRSARDVTPKATASNKPDGNPEAQTHVKHNEMRPELHAYAKHNGQVVGEADTGITATTVRLPDHVDREEYQALRIELNKAYKAGDKALHAKLAQKHYELTKG